MLFSAVLCCAGFWFVILCKCVVLFVVVLCASFCGADMLWAGHRSGSGFGGKFIETSDTMLKVVL